ncbi:hypothetical protein CBQ28_04565 [Pseudoalteromonas sp. GCY]|nr:hypothetical protein [Pseudoalteromonas sp. GCY]PHI38358.1 hypothetical protein CBQ28_04565 [Pseudoalteromonas sp. GCY]
MKYLQNLLSLVVSKSSSDTLLPNQEYAFLIQQTEQRPTAIILLALRTGVPCKKLVQIAKRYPYKFKQARYKGLNALVRIDGYKARR